MNKMQLVQAGVGGFGWGWIQNHSTRSPDFELAAICDVNPQALRRAQTELNIPADRCFETLEAALDAVKADAVLSVTPPKVHVQHARLVLGRGLHLMVEKPMSDSVADALEMVALARKANRQLVVSQNYRFQPAMHTLRKLMSAAPVGELGNGHLDFYIPGDFTGSFRETMPYVLLVDMAIHHMDLIRAVTGRNIESVRALTFNSPWSWYQHHAGLKMILELTGGVPFSYSGDWAALGRCTSWSGAWRLQCAQGSIHFDPDSTLHICRCERWAKNPTSEPIAIDRPPLEAQAATLSLFAQAIRSGKPAEISGQDNLWSFGAVMAGMESTRRDGARISVADLLAGHALPPLPPAK